MIPHEELERRLKLIADSAPGLRAAGVTSLEIDGDRVAVRYAPPYGALELPATLRPADDPPDEPTREPEIDALDDPSTYDDGVVPGYDPPPSDEEPA